MKFTFSMIKIKEHQAKRDTLFQLRRMSDRMLKDCDFSPELLKKGIKALPWRNTREDTIQTQTAYSINQKTLAPVEELKPARCTQQAPLKQRSAA